GWGMAALSAHAKWVRLVFMRATDLDDATGILEGTGKNMRHVKVRSGEAITERAAAIRSLLEQANRRDRSKRLCRSRSIEGAPPRSSECGAPSSAVRWRVSAHSEVEVADEPPLLAMAGAVGRVVGEQQPASLTGELAGGDRDL